MKGIDQEASIDSNELYSLKQDLVEAYKCMGRNDKKINKNIMKNKLVMCKSLVAKKNIKKNDKLTYDNVCFKRPGNGIPVKNLKKIIGKRVKRQINYDDLIMFKDLI